LPAIGVLALQGDIPEHLQALKRAGAAARPVRHLAEIETCDGLVIPGGESTTLSRAGGRRPGAPGFCPWSSRFVWR
jgi:5'-phosphate synthase pdxT subunit